MWQERVPVPRGPDVNWNCGEGEKMKDEIRVQYELFTILYGKRKSRQMHVNFSLQTI
jgi:hypothetical protein